MCALRCAAAGACDVACFHPLTAWQTDDGGIVFAERGRIRRELQLPCGQCIGCRLERSRQWAIRCVHESRMHDENSFLTLTYNDDHLPMDLSLHYRDFQLFMKRLRKEVPRVRFYMCGEYGEDFGRPHFHACVFGLGLRDRKFYKNLSSGSALYTSATLERLWPFGFSSVGDVNFESAAYVARYVMKKVTGSRAESHYEAVRLDTGEIISRVPEFCRMSLKPGIGATWYERYKRQVYPADRVVLRGREMRPPKYYDKLLAGDAGVMIDDVEFARYLKGLDSREDNTEARLSVREAVTKARLSFKIRSL